jgi:hypothetical protein
VGSSVARGCPRWLLKGTAQGDCRGVGHRVAASNGDWQHRGSGCSVAVCGDAVKVIQGTCLVPDGHHLMTDGLDGELA